MLDVSHLCEVESDYSELKCTKVPKVVEPAEGGWLF